jgi:hypothetical protein
MHKPEYLMTVITTSPGSEQVQEYVDNLCSTYHESEIILSGYQILGQDLKFPKNVKVMNYIRNIKEYLEEIDEVLQEK